ncbi:MAG TPA: type II toxin-antitoxin system HicB family antitoxin [Bacteroidales bacterium]|nr:type II toxin-antitoxin system HicB family antitoxin [Bacteroidales bacterium]
MKSLKNKIFKFPDFTAIIEKSDDGWYVGQIQEVPEAISQGKTIEELKENLIDALNLVLTNHRESTLSQYAGRKFIKRKLSFA